MATTVDINSPEIKFAKKRITELSAKFAKKDAKAGGKVTEFAYRDEMGRWRNDEPGMAGKVAGAGVLAAGAGAGLYARGMFPGSGRLRSAGRFAAPRSGGVGGVVDTARLGASHLRGDIGRIGAAAGSAASSGKAALASILRKVLGRGRG